MYEDGQYLKNNPTWHEQDSAKKAEWIEGILERNDVRPGSAAEVGCGVGVILRELSTMLPDCRLEGWDVSPQAVELAAYKAGRKVEVHLGDILASGRNWDALLAIDVLEHMENPAAFLRACVSRCEHLVVHLPLDLSVQTVGRPSPLLDRRRTLGHIHMFTPELARALVEENGWVVLDWRYTPGALDLPMAPGWRNWLKNVILRVPRRILFALSPDITVRFLGGWSILFLLKPSEAVRSA